MNMIMRASSAITDPICPKKRAQVLSNLHLYPVLNTSGYQPPCHLLQLVTPIGVLYNTWRHRHSAMGRTQKQNSFLFISVLSLPACAPLTEQWPCWSFPGTCPAVQMWAYCAHVAKIMTPLKGAWATEEQKPVFKPSATTSNTRPVEEHLSWQALLHTDWHAAQSQLLALCTLTGNAP